MTLEQGRATAGGTSTSARGPRRRSHVASHQEQRAGLSR